MDLLSERHIQQADKYSMGWIRFYLSQQTVPIIAFVHECVYNITCNCVCAQQYQFIPGFLLSLSPGRHRKEEVLLVQQLTTQESNQLLRFPPQNFQLKTVCISNFLSTMKRTIFEPALTSQIYGLFGLFNVRNEKSRISQQPLNFIAYFIFLFYLFVCLFVCLFVFRFFACRLLLLGIPMLKNNNLHFCPQCRSS